MIGELSEDLIMTGDEIDVENLFSDDGGEEETQVTPPAQMGKEEKEIEKTTEEEEISPDDLFDNPESVGSGKDNQEEEEDTQSEKDKGTSPKTNFYSSIASALKEEGIFPDLEDDVANQVYPQAANAVGKRETFVGRIRKDLDVENGIHMWVVSDNLLKGAAWNSVQIAETLHERGLVHPTKELKFELK